MSQFLTLIQREFWQNRASFVFLPAAAVGFFILLVVGVYVSVETVGVSADVHIESENRVDEWQVDGVSIDQGFEYMFENLAFMSERRRAEQVNKAIRGFGAPLLLVAWLVLLLYLLGSLYEERKDRSILFWKSMPVSDSLTVASKLFAGLVAMPLIFFLGIAVVQLTVLLVGTVASFGLEYSAFDLLWQPAGLFSIWFGLLGLLIFQALWCLPLYGWLIVVSSAARNVPLVWAIGLPFVIMVAESAFFRHPVLTEFLSRHATPWQFVTPEGLDYRLMSEHLFSLDGALGVGLGAVLIGLAIWFRRRADEL